VSLVISIAMVLMVFLVAYGYLLLKNPDALRSENFTLSKLAIEKGLVGDNISGLHQPPAIDSAPSAPLISLQGDEK
jgi:hypothetical protein